MSSKKILKSYSNNNSENNKLIKLISDYNNNKIDKIDYFYKLMILKNTSNNDKIIEKINIELLKLNQEEFLNNLISHYNNNKIDKIDYFYKLMILKNTSKNNKIIEKINIELLKLNQ
jgi:hypothetical protein